MNFLKKFPVILVSADFFKFLSIELAAGLNPPNIDNNCKPSYPGPQKQDQGVD